MLLVSKPGRGKTPVAATGPGRLLLIDTEGGSNYLARNLTRWDGRSSAPDGDLVVHATSLDDVRHVAARLADGSLRVGTVVLDTVTTLQQRARRDVAAASKSGRMEKQGWGILLDDISDTLRDLVDAVVGGDAADVLVLTVHAGTGDDGREITVDLQGSLASRIPGMVDVVGYLGLAPDETGPEARRLAIDPHASRPGADRTTSLPSGGLTAAYGAIIPGPINLADMWNTLNKETS